MAGSYLFNMFTTLPLGLSGNAIRPCIIDDTIYYAGMNNGGASSGVLKAISVQKYNITTEKWTTLANPQFSASAPASFQNTTTSSFPAGDSTTPIISLSYMPDTSKILCVATNDSGYAILSEYTPAANTWGTWTSINGISTRLYGTYYYQGTASVYIFLSVGIYKYDVNTKVCSMISSWAVGHQTGMVGIGDQVYFVGGTGNSLGIENKGMIVYDITQNLLSVKAQYTTTSYRMPIVWAIGTDIYCTGSENGTASVYAASGFIRKYDTLTNAWSTTTLPNLNCYNTGAVTYKGSAYIFGGSTTLSGAVPGVANALTTCYKYSYFLEAPTNFVSSLSGNKVVLNWTDVSTEETNYKIYRRAENEVDYTVIATLDPGTITYTDLTSDVSLHSYQYKLRAIQEA